MSGIASTVMLAVIASAEATTPPSFVRSAVFHMTVLPERPAVTLEARIEIPVEYELIAPATTPLKAMPGPVVDISTRPGEERDSTMLELTARFGERPVRLDPVLIEFAFRAPHPDRLDEPILIRRFHVEMDDGTPSRDVRVEIVVESHGDPESWVDPPGQGKPRD